ncbi:hypothetical protein R3W88_008067 [Solanum pinnatisectum]|uniref:Uncharacterized protein n=1 Tax=Solanum pinnatisectum TaxID=50273 RepID=A0AAV9M777_9SOLN|nr:hypothetical protein R3W88_008067 [Solanum pinnatisectum]
MEAISSRPTGEHKVSEPNIHDWVRIGGYGDNSHREKSRKAKRTVNRYAAGGVSVVAAANEVHLSSSYVSKSDGNGDKLSTVASAMAPSSSSTGSASTSTTQMRRDFSLEIYDKREFQFMVGSGYSENDQTSSSKS